VALIVIVAAASQNLGAVLRMPTQLTANDISRYCTVWALLERGSFAIDECPWQKETQDKVRKADPFSRETPAPVHVYSSKPPLLATIVAGLLAPVRLATGIPIDARREQPRIQRDVERDIPGRPGMTRFIRETPAPAVWPVYINYLKPVIALLNVVPFVIFLVLYTRLLDRVAPNDWAWFLSLIAAAYANFLVVFNTTLNNHTIAGYSAFFATYALARILEEGSSRPVHFVMAGFFGGFCVANELPAAPFGLVLFAFLLAQNARRTLIYFIPAAAVPLVAFFATQYAAFGQFRPVYEEFGTSSYNYEGSYWNTPLEFDALNLQPEPYGVYLFHMTLGHHGVFSLTPIVLFALYGAVRNVLGRDRSLREVSALTLFLTVTMLAFYTYNPKARNYGGSTQGLRWLFWLIPLWLMVLPSGLEAGQNRKGVRWLTLAALGVSSFSVGYAQRSPWTHPWIVDLLEHLDIFTLIR
jgi:hypothetical protein